MPDREILLIDLNNFGHYPTLSIGYMAAILRGAGASVSVVSPLAHGIAGVHREPRATRLNHIAARIRQETAIAPCPLVRAARERLRARAERRFLGRAAQIAEPIAAALDRRPDAVLISTYLMYAPVCELIAGMCRERAIPLLIGGQYFILAETIEQWLRMDGVTAIMCGEAEPFLADLVADLASGRPLNRYPGVSVPGRIRPPAAPLRELDGVPFPDFSDFPWSRYRTPMIPLVTGRGCGWGACTFCSDITSAAGRTFRSRSPENVLNEIDHQRDRYDARHFVFTDLKLNSSPDVWRALIAAGGKQISWIGAVHVGADDQDDGLGRAELRAARAAGAVRLTTGLESGSQRILDAMNKGTDLTRTSRFLRDAADAGISIRTTMIVGYPGETHGDLDRTSRFLIDHRDCIERVSLNRLAIVPGTRLAASVSRNPSLQVAKLTISGRTASTQHHNAAGRDRRYRRALAGVVNASHAINRKPLRRAARAFEGVM